MTNCKQPCQSAELAKLRRQQTESIALFQQLSKQVGIVWGQEIEQHLSTLTGSRYIANDWNMADVNGDQ